MTAQTVHFRYKLACNKGHSTEKAQDLVTFYPDSDSQYNFKNR